MDPAGFTGCVVVISTNCRFLDRVPSRVLGFERQSRATFLEGTVRTGGRHDAGADTGVQSGTNHK